MGRLAGGYVRSEGAVLESQKPQKNRRKLPEKPQQPPGKAVRGHMTTMSMALNCSFSDSGNPSSVIRTLMSSARANV